MLQVIRLKGAGLQSNDVHRCFLAQRSVWLLSRSMVMAVGNSRLVRIGRQEKAGVATHIPMGRLARYGPKPWPVSVRKETLDGRR